jgi:threonine/homoserine/homoserine lactone efflux protein
VTFQRWLAFATTSALVLVVPGPTILTLTSYAMAYGRRANALLVSAVTLGDLAAVSASLLGVGALLAASTTVFDAVKWAGAIYILYLGINRLRGQRIVQASHAEPTMAPWRLFGRMFGVALLNPKGIVFYVAFLPQFVDEQRQGLVQGLVLAITFVTLAAINASLYATGASLVSRRLASGTAARIVNLASGALLICAAAWAMTTHSTRR